MINEKFLNAKKHLNYVEETIKKNKAERKKQKGHLIHNQYDNVPLEIITHFVCSVGISALIFLFLKLPLGIAIAIGCSCGLMVSFVIPRIIHHSLVRFAKGKLGRGYAKLEQDYLYTVMKWCYKKRHKNLFKAKDSRQVSEAELKSFAKQAAVFAQNAKYDMDKNIYNKIARRYNKDRLKIKALQKKLQHKNNDLFKKKVQKIVEKNSKFSEPWRKLYNECGAMVKELYVQANSLDNSFEILEDKEYCMSKNMLKTFVANKVDESIVTTEKPFNAKTLSENTKQNDLNVFSHASYAKVSQNDDEKYL